MRKKRMSLIAIAAIVCMPLLMGNSSCSGAPQVSSSGATQVGAGQIIPKNSRGRTVEQQNIEDRIRTTTDPTKVMWIHLISLDGKVIKRMPIRNKVTSSGKRLEPKSAAANHEGSYMPSSGIKIPGTDSYYATNELIQPDGTFGDSDNYVFWFDPMGRYHQYGTAGGIGYLLTDYPIDLEDPINKITGLYNVQKQAAQWQEEQEAALRKNEGKK
jgi:hypothetical protein